MFVVDQKISLKLGCMEKVCVFVCLGFVLYIDI